MRPTSRTLCVVFLAAALAALSVSGFGQVPKPVTKGDAVTVTAVIVAIDSTNRLITLTDDRGLTEIIAAGPDVKRFTELKVGDKVTFRYYESVVYSIQPPGSTPPAAATTAVVRSTGPRPGGTMSEQQTVVVTIQAIDLAIPSVTIKTEKGETMSFKVEDKKNMEGVKVGDRVQITYTRALAINVESPNK